VVSIPVRGSKFWKAALISIATYTGAVLVGFVLDFRLTAFAVAAIQITWTLFCVIRVIQLRRDGSYKPDAPPYDRDSYEFALGGSISSSALLLAVVALSQAACSA
jgi:hypothetical protein